MNVKWLLENDVFDEDLEPLISEIKNRGMEVKVHQQFGVDSDFLELYAPEDCVIFYGSLQFAAQIRKKAEWIPGLFCTLPHFKCTYYYPQLSEFILNDRYVMLPFGEINRCKDFLLDTVGNNGCVFIRPDRGDKIFTGTVVTGENWEKDIELLGFYDVEPHEICVIGEHRNITKEWRLLVANNKIVTGSEYQPNQIADVPNNVMDFGTRVISSGFEPDLIWTIDVCQLKNKELRLLEVGSFSCAGMYECDVKEIVRYVSQAAQNEWEDYQL